MRIHQGLLDPRNKWDGWGLFVSEAINPRS
jgi:hypothetical protein